MLTFFVTVKINDMFQVFTRSTNCTNSIRCVNFAIHTGCIDTYIQGKVFFGFVISATNRYGAGIFLSLLWLLVKALLLFVSF